MRRDSGKFFFGLPDEAVADFGDALQVTLSFLGLLFNFELLDFLLECAGAGDELFFLFPADLEGIRLFANSSQLFFNACQALFRVGVAFFLQRLLFDFKLHGAAFEFIDLGRQ